MPLLLVTLLATSSHAPSDEVARETSESFEETCRPPMVPEGLPNPNVAPSGGRWTNADGTDGGGGTWLPAPLDADVLMRLKLLDLSPRVCAGIIRAERSRCTTLIQAELDAAIARSGAEHAHASADSEGRWPSWQVTALVIAGVVAGGAAGVGVGAVLYR